jgi:hypothetical protein
MQLHEGEESFLGDQNIEVEDDVLHINTAGRPSKDMEKVKKSLALGKI